MRVWFLLLAVSLCRASLGDFQGLELQLAAGRCVPSGQQGQGQLDFNGPTGWCGGARLHMGTYEQLKAVLSVTAHGRNALRATDSVGWQGADGGHLALSGAAFRTRAITLGALVRSDPRLDLQAWLRGGLGWGQMIRDPWTLTDMDAAEPETLKRRVVEGVALEVGVGVDLRLLPDLAVGVSWTSLHMADIWDGSALLRQAQGTLRWTPNLRGASRP
ncbi:MAG: hypothetical protein WC326_05485 [Candidatus Delongbacteria bacterium]